MDSPSKRKKPKAAKKANKRAAYPKSIARRVGALTDCQTRCRKQAT